MKWQLSPKNVTIQIMQTLFNFIYPLVKEKDKMKLLEKRMEELRKHQMLMGQPEVDFLGETESEGESLSEQTRTCSELEASLSRLALLDKTQQEIDQISVATETMLQQSKKFSFS